MYLLSIAIFILTLAGTATGQTAPYAGSTSCRECHEWFFQLWSTSKHGLAMQPYTLGFAAIHLTEHKDEIAIGKEEYRADMPRDLKTPKYYAIAIKPGIHYTMGGLKINTDTQVIAKDGKPIPGFYAAGEVAGGVHGSNRLGGNSISETITFGRIAGANAAKLVKTPAAPVGIKIQ